LAHERRRRTLEILKFRGCDHRKGEYTFAIDPRSGIEVVPTSAIELLEAASTAPISLGNPELDALCAGGIHSDSVLLVSGATGTGKTLMALQFVYGGLAAGERATLVSLEESAGQLVRNAASWGMDLESPLRQGRLRILSRYPERMGLEDFLVEIKRELQDFDPSRLVIDGMSALEQISNAKGFREFVVSVYSYLKRHQIAGLLTTTAKTLSGGDSASGANLSTAADGIILLRYLELEGEVRRGILVLKLRGRRHDHAIHEYEIDDQGMHVLGPIGGLGIAFGGASFVTGEARQRADLTDALRPTGPRSPA
jgi:circadian clock protein KaiC